MYKIISGVYEIRNIKNGHCYIGSSVSIKSRWNEHRRKLRENKHHNKHLQNAWNKYGENIFVFHIIETCERQETIEREQYYLDTLNPEYNIAISASAPTLGMKVSEETRRKLRSLRHSKEIRKKIGDARRGYKHSEITKNRISKAHLGKKQSPEQRKKNSLSHIGQTPWNKGISPTKEQTEKNRAAHLGKKDTQETRRKKSQAIKKWWAERKKNVDG